MRCAPDRPTYKPCVCVFRSRGTQSFPPTPTATCHGHPANEPLPASPGRVPIINRRRKVVPRPLHSPRHRRASRQLDRPAAIAALPHSPATIRWRALSTAAASPRRRTTAAPSRRGSRQRSLPDRTASAVAARRRPVSELTTQSPASAPGRTPRAPAHLRRAAQQWTRSRIVGCRSSSMKWRAGPAPRQTHTSQRTAPITKVRGASPLAAVASAHTIGRAHRSLAASSACADGGSARCPAPCPSRHRGASVHEKPTILARTVQPRTRAHPPTHHAPLIIVPAPPTIAPAPPTIAPAPPTVAAGGRGGPSSARQGGASFSYSSPRFNQRETGTPGPGSYTPGRGSGSALPLTTSERTLRFFHPDTPGASRPTHASPRLELSRPKAKQPAATKPSNQPPQSQATSRHKAKQLAATKPSN